VDEDYLLAFDTIFLPIFRSWAPELYLISAGFDAHIVDPLADMDLSSAAFGLMTQAILECAAERSTPVAMVLEGGYSSKALTEGASAVLGALAAKGPGNHPWRPLAHRPSPTVTTVLERVRSALTPRWPCLRRIDP